ncbi:hypothetical protein ZIOFF_003061 [Zingiber officinale]|uniref:XPG-I domain-containing protein n=1 Tax=Zingiber officinale TaxID=94328 RepID=A0A8J5I8R3_ZINOF|nr:hypothetical protein ZIOFF_003061 [Zingiber officinale]
MNQEVVKVILDCKRDVWKNTELFDLVKDYFHNNLQTLDFCTTLEKCLTKARDNQLILQVALQRFVVEEENHKGDNARNSRTLTELRRFKAAGDPFTEEFFKAFRSIHHQQLQMLDKMQMRKNNLEKKLKSIKVWRKVSSIIFVATFTTFLICSIVAAAIAAPPVAIAMAAAATIPIGSMGKYVFDGQPPELKKQELAKRYSKREDATNDLNTAIEIIAFGYICCLQTGDMRELKSTAKGLSSSQDHYISHEFVQNKSTGELSFLACFMNFAGSIVRVFTSIQENALVEKLSVMEFEVSKVLEELRLIMDQFIDLCILSGCDYCDSIKDIESCPGIMEILGEAELESHRLLPIIPSEAETSRITGSHTTTNTNELPPLCPFLLLIVIPFEFATFAEYLIYHQYRKRRQSTTSLPQASASQASSE